MNTGSHAEEVGVMAVRAVKKGALQRAVVRSTKASAELEGRTVPAEFVRSERVERFLAERRKRT
ncbi:MAG: hypothetical protein KDB25_08030 [Leucobacter sp.]|nr:hypothetical protein [Leucobacter sp.]